MTTSATKRTRKHSKCATDAIRSENDGEEAAEEAILVRETVRHVHELQGQVLRMFDEAQGATTYTTTDVIIRDVSFGVASRLFRMMADELTLAVETMLRMREIRREVRRTSDAAAAAKERPPRGAGVDSESRDPAEG